jgi:hypothetical protein
MLEAKRARIFVLVDLVKMKNDSAPFIFLRHACERILHLSKTPSQGAIFFNYNPNKIIVCHLRTFLWARSEACMFMQSAPVQGVNPVMMAIPVWAERLAL